MSKIKIPSSALKKRIEDLEGIKVGDELKAANEKISKLQEVLNTQKTASTEALNAVQEAANEKISKLQEELNTQKTASTEALNAVQEANLKTIEDLTKRIDSLEETTSEEV